MSETKKKAQERFGTNVDDARQRRGLSVDALAERSRLDRDELVRILEGEDEARASTVHLLAGALGVDPGDLFCGMSWVSPADGGSGYVIDVDERPSCSSSPRCSSGPP